MEYGTKGDSLLRGLERRAQESGASSDWAHYLARCTSAGQGLDRAASLLQSADVGAYRPALETLVRNGGVWIERDDAKSIVHVHGVMLSPKHDAPQEPYTLSWAQERLQHEERDYQSGGNDCFTQETALRLMPGLVHPSGLKLVLPTAPERDATLRALITARAFGRQPELVDYVQGFMRSDYDNWCLTSDRIVYGKKGKIIRAFGREDREEIPVDLRGSNSYVRDMQDAQAVINLLLGTDESIAQVDERYNRFLEVPNGAYLWRISGQGERAVVLGRYDDYDGFCIGADVSIDDWPARGCRRAKIFS